jgi:hypothetical protein
MMMRQPWLPMTALLVFVASGTSAQSTLTPAEATSFMGTWVINFTEPAAFKMTQTVRIWHQNGVVAASIQTGNRPQEVTGILQDANLLVLTINREAPSAMRENGVPIWSVMSLSLDGDMSKAALMLEPSQTIKKGTGKKQIN